MERKFLKTLVEAASPSGFEFMALPVIREIANQKGWTLETDNIGNIYLRKPSEQSKPKNTPRMVMVAAHLDEIGMILSAPGKSGLWHFERLGGIDPKTLAGQKVRCYQDPLGNPGDYISGVIGKKAIHLETSKERENVPELYEYAIDFGGITGLKPGLPVVPEKLWTDLGQDLFSAPGLDDKAGVWVALEVLDKVRVPKGTELVCVLTAQEETGLRGARVAAQAVKPWLSIDIDVTHATDDGHEANDYPFEYKIGSGPVLYYGPDNDYEVISKLDNSKISHQTGAKMPGGTNTSAIQIWGSCKTALVSIPQRNMHTPVEICSWRDLEGSARIIIEYIEKL